MALALYRKYRPKKLEDILGQEDNVLILKNAAKQDKLGHAYLFYGSRGTGKTSTARLIAKLFNCEKRAIDQKFRLKGEPCNECTICTEIDGGSSLDVIEIDAASNRGIDEIRNLKENIRFAPATARFKVYIIDEAHMLTGAAFNALLKTLEEPPAHGVLVLATTEYEKLPPTITSRTQRFLFKKLPKSRIAEKLALIAQAEGISIDAPALELIAAAAEGSLRDAESLLDQIKSAHTSIDLPLAERLTGRIGVRRVSVFSELVLQNKLKESLAYLAVLYEEGNNLVQFTKDLIHYLRKVLALRVNPSLRDALSGELTSDEIKEAERISQLQSPDEQVKFLKSLLRAYSEMRYSPFQMIPLEVALIENLKE